MSQEPANVWDRHVSAALLGTRRRAVPVLPEAPEQGDAAGRLLDQAAVLTLRRRAGRTPGNGIGAEAIAPAPAEDLPAVPPEAARRLERILGGERIRVLPEWLDAASAHGRRVPARLLPELLERGRGDRMLRASIARASGRRGVWLALLNTDWAYLAGTDPGEGPDGWETGTRNQRVAHLTRLRGTDPATARETLRETWPKEPAPDRAAFLATFEHGLSLADEDFLESALDDRGKEVRQLASDLLARLPGSAYGERMAARARACLRPTPRARILVEPPRTHDEGLARDGVAPPAAWPHEILARTPLSTWTELFGLPPTEIVRLPVIDAGDRAARDVHLGWAGAALRQRDTEWTRALVTGGVLADEPAALADLISVLPEPERTPAAAELIRGVDGRSVPTVLERVPGPWTGRLADAVVATVAAAAERATHRYEPTLTRLCRLADLRLDPEVAPRLDDLARRHGADTITELTETLRFRDEMLKELAP
ncbi:DUF5691 domain-containing protein [Pseudonocardia acaciae]|uniref:DUF5691 domain-containing protein n=1 Tax=Pseudonocardia acaciae TaxID=551276 RepID=UPI0004906340|nr:DUF5691 domain-containing protein [Pseudonocardia acaciae]